ncbi:MAG: hypothetical protein J6Y79_00815 [Paludibacteraceae bacterium]|nr:hypothetical protein [Paludibacteraceae bacterium]
MNIKQAIIRLWHVLTSPSTAWRELSGGVYVDRPVVMKREEDETETMSEEEPDEQPTAAAADDEAEQGVVRPTETELKRTDARIRQEDKDFFRTWLLLDALVTFIAGLINAHEHILVSSLLKAMVSVLSFWSALWIIYYFLRYFLSRKCGLLLTIRPAVGVRLIVYPLTLGLLLHALGCLMPRLFFLNVLLLYDVYLVWEGVGLLLRVEENDRSRLVSFLTLLIIFVPILLEKFIELLIPLAGA